jgi:hypothetical protein
MTELEHFAAYLTGGSLNGFPSNQKLVFYGNFAPVEITLEEFAEKFSKFIKKLNENGISMGNK